MPPVPRGPFFFRVAKNIFAADYRQTVGGQRARGPESAVRAGRARESEGEKAANFYSQESIQCGVLTVGARALGRSSSLDLGGNNCKLINKPKYPVPVCNQGCYIYICK
eukprot:SAG31_NODE_1101_length_9905_cov_3.367122_6_plen_109_part_00